MASSDRREFRVFLSTLGCFVSMEVAICAVFTLARMTLSAADVIAAAFTWATVSVIGISAATAVFAFVMAMERYRGMLPFAVVSGTVSAAVSVFLVSLCFFSSFDANAIAGGVAVAAAVVCERLMRHFRAHCTEDDG